MKINHYRFPENTPTEDKLKEGCAVVLKDGSRIYADAIPKDKADLVDYVDDTLGGITVTHAKSLLRKYGGTAVTEHIDRDGCCFETTPVQLKGNNSSHKYNRHL